MDAPEADPSFDDSSTVGIDPTARIARMERALIGSRDGFWERNLRSNVSWYSSGFRAMFGFADDELPNDRTVINTRVHPDDLPRFLDSYDRAIRSLGHFDYELRFLDRSERWRWVRGRGQVWAGADGEAEMITGAVSDVTAEKQALLAVEEQRQRLEQLVQERTASLSAALLEAEQRRREADDANEAKSRFLAHMSHEIRTPLNGILGLTELALRVEQMPSVRRYLEVSLQSGHALLQVINNVLDFSRLQAGRLAIDDQPFDLSAATAETLRAIAPLVRTKNLSTLYDYIGDITWVRGDAPRLCQILTNLLGNAVKFTERGHMKLSAELRGGDGDTCTALVSVEDSGPGIEPWQLERLFDAFEQGDSSAARQHGGTGLGLSIARGLARAMGGDIVARSQPGVGTTFSISLPLRTAPDPHPLPLPPPGHAWLLYLRKVAAELMQRRLGRMGWTATVMADLPEVIAQARHPQTARPQLLIITAQMLGSGVDLPALAAALPTTRIAVLVRADWDQPQTERLALDLGMSVVVLPLTPRDLVLLASAGGAAKARQIAATPDALLAMAPVLVVEDNEVNRLVCSEFLHAIGVPVRVADGGEAALSACAAETPSLVLMDLQMPGMDGFEATRRLRALQRDGSLPPFPIVALTAHAMAGDAADASAAGMDGLLCKPIMLGALRLELSRWLPALVATPLHG